MLLILHFNTADFAL